MYFLSSFLKNTLSKISKISGIYSVFLRLPDLSEQGVAEYRDAISQERPFRPVHIAQDPRKGTFHVWDGFHRIVVTALEENNYILGRFKGRQSMASEPLTWEQLRLISHGDYRDLVRQLREEAGVALYDPMNRLSLNWEHGPE